MREHSARFPRVVILVFRVVCGTGHHRGRAPNIDVTPIQLYTQKGTNPLRY